MAETVRMLFALSRQIRELVEETRNDPYFSADDRAELNSVWTRVVDMRNMVRDRRADDLKMKNQ